MSLTGNATAKRLRGKINKVDVIYIDTYEIAVRNGYEGTVEEWLATLNNDCFADEVTGELYKLYVSNGKLMMRKVEV